MTVAPGGPDGARSAAFASRARRCKAESSGAARWTAEQPTVAGRRVGYFGASTGAAAALVAAAEPGEEIGAVVSRGGRPDLAGVEHLRRHPVRP